MAMGRILPRHRAIEGQFGRRRRVRVGCATSTRQCASSNLATTTFPLTLQFHDRPDRYV
jgi:hypothetical protein